MKRPSLALGLLLLAAFVPRWSPLLGDDKDGKAVPPPASGELQPNVSIAPRARAANIAPESARPNRFSTAVRTFASTKTWFRFRFRLRHRMANM
jgi:hypothetical protein